MIGHGTGCKSSRSFLIGTALALFWAGVCNASLLIVNGDFETDAVADNTEASTVDISSWVEGTPTAGWYEWLKDSDGLFGGAGNNYGVLSGNANATAEGTSANGVWIAQSIGTIDSGTTSINISGFTSDRGDRDGTDRHAAIVEVSLWYDDGTAVLLDGTRIDDASYGLTSIGKFNVGASAGGTYTTRDASALDIDLAITPQEAEGAAWDWDFDLSGTGASAGDTVHLMIRYNDASAQSRSEAYFDDLTVTAIPEPATIGLFGLVGIGLFAARRFRSY